MRMVSTRRELRRKGSSEGIRNCSSLSSCRVEKFKCSRSEIGEETG